VPIRRADRLFDILRILRSAKAPVTAASIADELEVTSYRLHMCLLLPRLSITFSAGRGRQQVCSPVTERQIPEPCILPSVHALGPIDQTQRLGRLRNKYDDGGYTVAVSYRHVPPFLAVVSSCAVAFRISAVLRLAFRAWLGPRCNRLTSRSRRSLPAGARRAYRPDHIDSRAPRLWGLGRRGWGAGRASPDPTYCVFARAK
jgi:hypothetical protein